ncbi:peptidase S8/S53 domain-containing protein [Mycena sanguinolenta]|nr:peptidase S8/S53 domain-containing protein [Mycena sanguinolenta]
MVTFDTAGDLDAHLAQLQNFIDNNKNCSALNNSISITVNEDFMKFYAGTFDGRVLNFISGAEGVQELERSLVLGDQNPDDGPSPGQEFSRRHNAPRVSWLSRLFSWAPRAPKTLSRIPPERHHKRSRTGVPWNLARISKLQGGPLQLTAGGPSATSQTWTSLISDSADGLNVAIYVVDTGVRSTHLELANSLLASRVVTVGPAYILSQVGGSTDDVDGHGTGVVSVAAGLTLGVAPNAAIIPMKIMGQYQDLMDDTNRPTVIPSQYLVAGISNAIKHYTTVGNGRPAIINISITMWRSVALETIVSQAVAAGMHVVVAAGNEGQDVCGRWIRNMGQITVGATNIADEITSFSNSGPCVDLYAPGDSILGATVFGNSDTTTRLWEGTSFSAPLVSGMIAALISSGTNLGPAAMKARIIQDATGTITNIANFANTNNRLALLDPSTIDLMGF